MSGEEDPKEAAKKEVRSAQVQQLLRQFMTDGPKGNTKNYKENIGRAIELKCLSCDGFGTQAFTPIPGGKTYTKYERTSLPCTDCDGSGNKP